jgi:hypothetical protein
MSHDTALKQIFNTKPEGVRSVGRPKLRWEDGVNQDIKKHQVSTSGRIPLSRERERERERDEWTQLVKKAMAHQGLSSR